MIGSCSYATATWSDVMELLRHGLVDLEPIVTHRFPAARFEDAFALMDAREGVVAKVLLEHVPPEACCERRFAGYDAQLRTEAEVSISSSMAASAASPSLSRIAARTASCNPSVSTAPRCVRVKLSPEAARSVAPRWASSSL